MSDLTVEEIRIRWDGNVPYPTMPVNVQRDIKTLLAKLDAQAADIEKMRDGLRDIADKECEVVYANHPEGATCLDVQRHVMEHPDKYSNEFAAILASGTRRCNPCVARAALGSGEADG